jgi:hypothetical protein
MIVCALFFPIHQRQLPGLTAAVASSVPLEEGGGSRPGCTASWKLASTHRRPEAAATLGTLAAIVASA